MELLENFEKWRSWLGGWSADFLRKWEKTRGEEAEEKLQILSYYQKKLEEAFADIIGQCKSLIKEYNFCGIDWFYTEVLQDNKPSEYVKDCADIVYYEMPLDEKYADTLIFKSAKLIYENFGLLEGEIYPDPPDPLPENAEQWQIEEWNESMADALEGIPWDEGLDKGWLITYVLIVAFYAALKNEEVLFLVKEGEAVDDGEFVLPEEIDTERARKYFPIAIEAGFMKMTADGKGCRWTFGGNRGKVRLASFLVKVYCPTNTEHLPLKAVEKFFNEERLDSAVHQFNGTNKGQKWIPIIDELFED